MWNTFPPACFLHVDLFLPLKGFIAKFQQTHICHLPAVVLVCWFRWNQRTFQSNQQKKINYNHLSHTSTYYEKWLFVDSEQNALRWGIVHTDCHTENKQLTVIQFREEFQFIWFYKDILEESTKMKPLAQKADYFWCSLLHPRCHKLKCPL